MGLFMHPPHFRTKTMTFVVMAMTLWTCSAADPVELHGSGTTNPSKYFWKVMDLFEERAKIPLYMTYRAVGSSTGMAEFIGEDNPDGAFTAYNHFGSGDVPMKSSLFPSLAANSRSMVHIPFVMGAIAIFHSVPESNFGDSGEVDLDACLLAKIFSRKIKTWDDPAIVAANPGMKVPAGTNIKVVHRVKGSSSTAGTTEYLSAACPSEWDLGSGTTVAWAADTFEGQGSDGISDYIAANEYAIGYIDAGHGHSLGLSEVALKNKNGKNLKSDAADIGAAGAVALAAGDVIPADASADWSAVNLYDQTGDTTWPITMFSYFYVEKDLSAMNADTAALLHAFITYTLSAEGQDLLEDFRFSKVSTEVLTYNTATLNSITWPTGMTQFTFELKGETQKGAGAMNRVISGKRRSYADYERSLFDGRITDLEAKLTSMETQNADLLQRIAALEGADTDAGPAGVGVAALVVGLFSFFLASGATYLALKPRSAELKAESKDLKANPDGVVNGAHSI